MEILAAYDLTQSYRDAAALVGCAPNTVSRYVLARDAGELKTAPAQRDQLIDPFRDKIEEWVDASHGRIRGRCPAQARGDGLYGLGAHDAAGGRRNQGDVSRWPPTSVSAVAAGAWSVVSVGLRRRAAGQRVQNVVVVRVAGLEPLPGRVADSGQDAPHGDRLYRRDAPPIWRRTDVWLERQRENAVGRPHRTHCGAQPDDRGGRPLVRSDLGQLCA